ncbi:MAG: hypothetical protein ABI681_01545 [Gemmatimonadales bacterium]
MADWLAARIPSPPPDLALRLDRIAGEQKCDGYRELSSALLANAEKLLAELGTDRDAAPDLLAADALITYAIEAAAENCASVDDVSADALVRIGRISSSDGQS